MADTEPSAMEFTKVASGTLRRRWRDTLRSPVFWRAFFCGIGRTFTPKSPLGPGVGGMLSVLLTMLLAWIVAPLFIKATVWWWSLWLGR